MTEPTAITSPVLLASFFKRLESMEAVLRIILSQARLSALFTFRGQPEKKVLLDFSNFPARVIVDDRTRSGNLYVTIDGDIMHEILLDYMKPGLAVGRRQMLLRGSAGDLAKFIPLFDFGPLLYNEHLADVGITGFTRKSGQAPLKEAVMTGQVFNGDPIPLRKLTTVEKIMFKLINGLAFGIGYVVGFLRYRVMENMSLFETMSFLSKGVEAASPKQTRLTADTEKSKPNG